MSQEQTVVLYLLVDYRVFRAFGGVREATAL
jgi:hypothetical protein